MQTNNMIETRTHVNGTGGLVELAEVISAATDTIHVKGSTAATEQAARVWRALPAGVVPVARGGVLALMSANERGPSLYSALCSVCGVDRYGTGWRTTYKAAIYITEAMHGEQLHTHGRAVIDEYTGGEAAERVVFFGVDGNDYASPVAALVPALMAAAELNEAHGGGGVLVVYDCPRRWQVAPRHSTQSTDARATELRALFSTLAGWAKAANAVVLAPHAEGDALAAVVEAPTAQPVPQAAEQVVEARPYTRLREPRRLVGFCVEIGTLRERVPSSDAATCWEALTCVLCCDGWAVSLDAVPVVLPDGTELYRMRRTDRAQDTDVLAVVTPCEWWEHFERWDENDAVELPPSRYSVQPRQRAIEMPYGVWAALREALPGVARA